MVANVCSRSHGQPLPGVRRAAMISISPQMFRDGVIAATSEVRGHGTKRALPRRPRAPGTRGQRSFAAGRPDHARGAAAARAPRLAAEGTRDSHKRYYGIIIPVSSLPPLSNSINLLIAQSLCWRHEWRNLDAH